MAISEDIIQKIKEQTNIVDIISETVKLKRTGRNYSGLCPFHHEKSPSFSVSSDKQIYKCFGCGEAGNVISFVMKTKNMSFPDAVKFLGDRVNITIENDSKQSAVNERREKLFKINVEAARYFFSNLNLSSEAKQYFNNRGISTATVRRFGLGFSFDNWNGLLRHLKSKGYSELDLLSVGLIVSSQKGTYYDRFRNRVMFPVFDYKGKVIGFGGRVLDDSKPKYLNSPETDLFKKGTNLYGLNFAIKDTSNRTFLIVEGYMDCISLHQYGISNAVASLGTALTVNQAKLLKRYCDKVIIAYDADVAGQSATVRGLEILKSEGFEVSVLTVPQGKDPDEFIRANGKEAFLKLMNDALPLIEYRIKRAGEGIDFNNREMLIQYAKKVSEILINLDSVEKDVYINKISEETGIKEQAIYDWLSSDMQKNVNNLQEVNINSEFGQKLYVEPAFLKASRNLLKLMIDSEECFDLISNNLNKEDLPLGSHKKIFNILIENKDIVNNQNLIETRCDDIESSKEWVEIKETTINCDESELHNLINDYIREIKKFKLEESKKEVMNKIKKCEANGMLQETLNLAKELIKIQKDMANL